MSAVGAGGSGKWSQDATSLAAVIQAKNDGQPFPGMSGQ